MICCPNCKHEFQPEAPASPLTARQRQLLQFIQTYIEVEGYAPSYAEMQRHMSLSSKSGVNRMVGSLVQAGRIRHGKGRTRAISIVGTSS